MSDLKAKLTREFLDDEEVAYAYYNDFLNLYIATQIKTLREQRGYKTQSAFAREKGIAQEQMSHLENIDTNAWSVNTLRKIARKLGVVVKVSFESFSEGIDTIANFRRETLVRPERVEDLSRFISPSAGPSTNQALTAAYNDARESNQPDTLIQHFEQRIPEQETPSKEATLYEALKRKPSPSDMVVPTDGPQSAREGYRPRRVA